ncbi:MAG: DNA primase [Chloroflexota bacterium]
MDEIKQRLDVVELIGGYVPLLKAGRNYKALCPFHSEKTPSFVVFPDTQSWHCFGACSTGGDIFGFVMRRENLEFREALQLLAQRAGVQLAPLDDIELARRDELDRLRAINAEAAQFYHRLLTEDPRGAGARAYLERRGLTRASLERFQLGYAPDEWHALENHLKRKSHAQDDVLSAGLLSEGERGNVYDRFRGRVMFPIRDAQGHVIGFGGRVLDDTEPKYLNTSQTPLFDKSSVLYGIDLAREPIRQSETAVVVEGYMDVIVPHQCGAANLVACMGTALSEEHIKVLKRLAKRIVLALDPDAAGMRAVERGVAALGEWMPHRVVPVPTARGLIRYEERLDAEIRILRLPKGMDPDELVLADPQRWSRMVAEALPVADYFFQVTLEGANLATAKGKREVADRLLPVIADMENPVERSHYLQRLAGVVRVDERELLRDLDRLRAAERRGRRPERAQAGAPATGDEPGLSEPGGPGLGMEERGLALLLRAPELVPDLVREAGLGPEVFSDVRNRQVFVALQAQLASQGGYDVEALIGELDTQLKSHVESILRQLELGPALAPDGLREDAWKSIARLRRAHLLRLIGAYRFMQQDAQAQGAAEQLREYNLTIQRLTRDCRDIERRFHAVTFQGRREARTDQLPKHGS